MSAAPLGNASLSRVWSFGRSVSLDHVGSRRSRFTRLETRTKESTVCASAMVTETRH